jgi:hypothetical protein
MLMVSSKPCEIYRDEAALNALREADNRPEKLVGRVLKWK